MLMPARENTWATRFRAAAGAGFLMTCTFTVARAQETAPDTRDVGRSLLQGLSPLLVVKVVADCARLKEYITSDEFAAIRRGAGDLVAVDALYDRALDLSWHNIPEALFISAFATMDHRRVGVRLPGIGALLWFPLTSEFSGDFSLRLRALPSRLYPDTPNDPGGDRDKLQHFFGSAFLAYSAKSNDPAERVGDFVEDTEEEFIVGGVNDVRDKRSNGHGRRFGLMLLADENALPSKYFLLAPPSLAGPDRPRCVPDSERTPMEER